MWILLTRRVRTWLLMAIAAPILGWLLNRAAAALERRRGQTRTSRTLRRAARMLNPRRHAAEENHQGAPRQRYSHEYH
jgi:hypothetical protein